MATWDIFDSRQGTVRRGLTAEEIQQALAAGDIVAADFVRPSQGGRYRRIREVPELAPPEVGRRRRRGGEESVPGMDLTPMVDVVFQLLLFFMLTASYTLQGTLPVPSPDRPAEGARQALPTLEELSDDHIVVEIRADNSFWVDNVAVSAEALEEAIRAARRASGRHDLIVSADPDAYHDSLVQVLDAAAQAGMQHIQMAAPAGEPLGQ